MGSGLLSKCCYTVQGTGPHGCGLGEASTLGGCSHEPLARVSSPPSELLPSPLLCLSSAEGSRASWDLFPQQRKVQRKKKRRCRMGKTEVKAAPEDSRLNGSQSYPSLLCLLISLLPPFPAPPDSQFLLPAFPSCRQVFLEV